MLRGGAAEVKRHTKGSLQLRILLKAHGLEEAPLSDGVEITALVDADLRLVDGRGCALQEMNLRIQKVERVDSRGFRTQVEGAGERQPKPRKRAKTPAVDFDSGETRRDRERRARQDEERKQKLAQQREREAEERRRAKARAEEERRAEAERRRAEMQRQLKADEAGARAASARR